MLERWGVTCGPPRPTKVGGLTRRAAGPPPMLDAERLRLALGEAERLGVPTAVRQEGQAKLDAAAERVASRMNAQDVGNARGRRGVQASAREAGQRWGCGCGGARAP